MPNCGQLYYEVHGEGEPLLLLHGNTLDCRMWEDLLPSLTDRYRVIIPDLPGHGRSGLSPSDSTPAEELVRLLDHIGADRAIIGGLSLGGMVALNLALDHPQRCAKLILIDSALHGYRYQHLGMRTYFETARTEGIKAAMALWLTDPLFAPALASPAAARLREIVMEFPGLSWVPPLAFVRPEPKDTDRLEQLQAPLLVIVGEFDTPDFHGIADLLARSVAGARKVVITGCGHMSPMERPDAVAAAILAFLEG